MIEPCACARVRVACSRRTLFVPVSADILRVCVCSFTISNKIDRSRDPGRSHQCAKCTDCAPLLATRPAADKSARSASKKRVGCGSCRLVDPLLAVPDDFDSILDAVSSWRELDARVPVDPGLRAGLELELLCQLHDFAQVFVALFVVCGVP